VRAIAFVVVLSMVLLSTAALAGEVSTEAIRTDPARLTLAEDALSKRSKAEVPGLMSYQGTLTDDSGVVLDSMDFFIGKAGEDGTFHIENGGNVGIGTTSPG
jgi:hypothetical protein